MTLLIISGSWQLGWLSYSAPFFSQVQFTKPKDAFGHHGHWPLKLSESKIRQRRVFYRLWSCMMSSWSCRSCGVGRHCSSGYHTIVTRILTLVAEEVPPPPQKVFSRLLRSRFRWRDETWHDWRPIQARRVLVPYFCILYFLWRHRWCSGSLFGWSEFFVNNFWSHWEESRERNHSDGIELQIDWYATFLRI